MTTEQTITIHHEPPADDVDRGIMAFNIYRDEYEFARPQYVRHYWTDRFTAWYDPQIGEPVKAAAKYEVRRNGVGKYDVLHAEQWHFVACDIPTRSAAQAIADIYERAAEGGEA